MPTREELAPAAQPGEIVQDMSAPAGDSATRATVKDVSDDDLSGFDAGLFVDESEETEVTQEQGDIDAPTPTPTPTPAVEPKPAESATPAPKEPQPAEAAQPPVPPTAPVAPPQAPAVEPTVAPAAPSEPVLTEAQQQEQYTQWYNSSVESLQNNIYQLDPEVAAELDREPSKVLPKLAAQMHMQVLIAATTQAANLFQTMLPEFTQRQTQESALVNSFYEEYPTLRGHEKDIDEISNTWASMNKGKGKSLEQARKEIAAIAHVQLRVPLPAQMQPPAFTPPPAAVTPTGAVGAPAPAAALPQEGKSWMEDLLSED